MIILFNNSYQFVENINKLKNITSTVTYDFKYLLNYINLQDLNKIIYSFRIITPSLQLPNNMNVDYFKALNS